MNRYWINTFLVLIVIVAIVANFQNANSLAFTCVAVVLIILSARFWNKHIFDKLTINRSLSQKKISPGQFTFYQIEIKNRKFIPVIWLRLRDKVTPGLSFINEKFVYSLFGGQGLFQDIFSLRWYEILKKKYKFYASERGIYTLGGGELLYYGLLGLYSNRKNDPGQIELTVYPRIVPVLMPKSGYSQLFGTRMKEGWIYRDQLNKVGVRPYQPGDRLKQINWKASARHFKLESDIYKPSFDKEIHFFLDNSYRRGVHSGKEKNRMELAIICTASLMDRCFKDGFKTGFYTNFSVRRNSSEKGYTVIPADKNPYQREKIMTTMARLQDYSIVSISHILRQEKFKISSGSTIVLISLQPDEDLNPMLNYFNKFYRLSVIQVGGNRENLPGIKSFYLKDKEDWHEIKQIELYS